MSSTGSSIQRSSSSGADNPGVGATGLSSPSTTSTSARRHHEIKQRSAAIAVKKKLHHHAQKPTPSKLQQKQQQQQQQQLQRQAMQQQQHQQQQQEHHQPLPLLPKQKENIIPRAFAHVEHNIYRSNMFTPASFPFIATLGLASCVVLSLEPPTRKVRKFFKASKTQLHHQAPKIWKPSAAWRPICDDVMKDTLELLLNVKHHPLLIVCVSGANETGALVGCLRRMQHWSFSSIVEEYERFVPLPQGSSSSSRFDVLQFIELFDTDLVTLPASLRLLPSWFKTEQILWEEDAAVLRRRAAAALKGGGSGGDDDDDAKRKDGAVPLLLPSTLTAPNKHSKNSKNSKSSSNSDSKKSNETTAALPLLATSIVEPSYVTSYFAPNAVIGARTSFSTKLSICTEDDD
jgi:hypothetical protein